MRRYDRRKADMGAVEGSSDRSQCLLAMVPTFLVVDNYYFFKSRTLDVFAFLDFLEG